MLVVLGEMAAEILRCEEAAGSNLIEAFFQREELRDLPPLAGVAEVGEVEALISRVLKSGELGVEER
jgi:hypothetical protein